MTEYVGPDAYGNPIHVGDTVKMVGNCGPSDTQGNWLCVATGVVRPEPEWMMYTLRHYRSVGTSNLVKV